MRKISEKIDPIAQHNESGSDVAIKASCNTFSNAFKNYFPKIVSKVSRPNWNAKINDKFWKITKYYNLNITIELSNT